VDDTFIDGLNWSMSHQKTGGVSQHGAVQVRVLTQKGDKTARNQDAVALLSSSIEHAPLLIPYLSWSCHSTISLILKMSQTRRVAGSFFLGVGPFFPRV